MKAIPPSLENLVGRLSRLPGVGRKTALRLALHLVKHREPQLQELISALETAYGGLCLCRQCYSLADTELCQICSSPDRRDDLVCVVEGYPELLALEEAGAFDGRYHVMNGLLSPMRGVGPEVLHLPELAERCRDGFVKEVIVATSLTSDGETTTLFIRRLLSGTGVSITRPASGIPFGSSIEYLDMETLGKALRERKTVV